MFEDRYVKVDKEITDLKEELEKIVNPVASTVTAGRP